MGSKEDEDGSKRADIVRGRARFLWGEVDVSTEDGDKYVLVPADSSREKVRMKGGSRGRWGPRSPTGRGWRNEDMRVQGKVDKGWFWWSGDFFVQGRGHRERWID